MPLFLKIGNDFLLLQQIYVKEKLLEGAVEVKSAEKRLYRNPEYFIGSPNTEFIIKFYRKNEYITQVQCDSNSKKIFHISFEDGFYDVEISMKKKTLFNTDKVILHRKKYCFGDEKKIIFKNKTLFINQVMLLDLEKEESCRPFYINNINYLGDCEGCDVYSGELFFINSRNGVKKYADYMKNTDGQSVKINPLRIELKTKRTCYIGYGLDDNMEYNDEFTLNRDGRLSISVKDNGIRNKSIDYYILEVKENV